MNNRRASGGVPELHYVIEEYLRQSTAGFKLAAASFFEFDRSRDQAKRLAGPPGGSAASRVEAGGRQ
jgi:hypothetical protein